MFEHINRYIHIEFLKFILSAGLATAAHWFVMAVLMHLGKPAITATAVGAMVGAVVNYVLQRNITFQSKISHRTALLSYLFVCMQIWAANLLIFYTLHYRIEINAAYSQVITTFIVALISYLLYKRVVFHDR